MDMKVTFQLISLGIFSGPKLGIPVLNIPFHCLISVRWEFFWLVLWFVWGFLFVFVAPFLVCFLGFFCEFFGWFWLFWFFF